MATLTVQTLKGPHPTTVAANSLDIAFTASTPGGDKFAATGREILVVSNSDPEDPYTFSVTSQPDSYGRTTSILTSYSLAAGETAMFWFGSITGWRDSSGFINLTSQNAAITYAVVKIPA